MFWTANITQNTLTIDKLSRGEKIFITRWALNQDVKGNIDLLVQNENKAILISRLERGKLEEAKINLQFTNQAKLITKGNGSVTLFGFKHTIENSEEDQLKKSKMTVAQMLAQSKLPQHQQVQPAIREIDKQEKSNKKEQQPEQSNNSHKIEKLAQKSQNLQQAGSVPKQVKSVYYSDEEDWFSGEQISTKKVKL